MLDFNQSIINCFSNAVFYEFLCVIFPLYAIFILINLFFIYKSKKKQINLTFPSFFSIIIITKNGDLSNILDFLNNKTLNFEVLIGDDNSTVPISEKLNFSKYNFDISIERIEKSPWKSSKKYLLDKLIKKSKYEKIITLDDDTIINDSFLDFASRIDINKYKYVNGLIIPYSKKENLLIKIFAIDFIGFNLLQISTTLLKIPLYANANNQIFSKTAYLEVKPFENNKDIKSGDDFFIMHYISKKYPYTSIFSEKFYTKTEIPSSFLGFIKQRLRWNSKTHLSPNKYVILIGVIIYLFYLMLFTTLFKNPYLFWLLIILKTIIDYLFILPAKKLIKENLKINTINLFFYTLITEIFQLFYITIITPISIIYGNLIKWK